ncbi:hypothetical protein CcrC1_gp050c [Caulobacter phage C1]|nr:hypothetical protein CcrC1_gp050c [Caulobacter phage C1]UTU08277.1 hypothetical protein CcrC2_gp049c [Caulobacter phage C2]UTU08800.1 hypothetical protein CcrJ4_gp049c [Caulobacter phage J4]UTU09352.1 hypothetical protein CcrBL47_gp066c [Caulobacter phage BL47]UTU09912.1 hypothetical protein CcrRB23_gp050c [Caulobacter phage RB23]WGN96937.1 hypothetical protein [Bertelyvirus sp.]
MASKPDKVLYHHHEDCILCQMGECDGTGWEPMGEEPNLLADIAGIVLWLVFLVLMVFAFYDGFLPPLLDWMRHR